jgi:hypothetical protein
VAVELKCQCVHAHVFACASVHLCLFLCLRCPPPPPPLMQQVPNLAALPPPRAIGEPLFKSPECISLASDGSILVGDFCYGTPAKQVWPDGSRPPQELPPATNNATTVLAIDGDVGNGLIVVSFNEGRVERTGHTAWKRTDFLNSYAAVVVGDVVLVSSRDMRRVTSLDIVSGATRGTFGEDVLKSPHTMAVGPGGEIFVLDDAFGTKLVHVFDGHGRLLRTIGQGLLKLPFGMCVDNSGRVYVADHTAEAIVVLDGVSGAKVAFIIVKGAPNGVAVTHRGQIVVGIPKAKRLFVFG